MQSQSKLYEIYQEMLISLKALHPDLDLKLTQPQYDDDLDILRAVYLKVTLNDSGQTQQSQNQLKPLTSLSKSGDFFPAKITYLTQLKASKMDELETTDAELENDLRITQEDVQNFKERQKAKKLAEAEMKLKQLNFIKSVSYALQQTQRKINNLAGAAKQVKEEQKDNNIGVLINEWNEKYDPYTDIDAEIKDVQINIETLKQKNQPRKLKEEEEKHALLLKIVEAQKHKIQPENIFSDQEIYKEIQTLQEELEVQNLEQAQKELEYEQDRRPELLKKPKKLELLDLRIEKLKRLIYLQSQNNNQENPKIIEILKIEL